MNTNNIFDINHLKISKFLMIIAIIQILVISLITLDLFGYGIPFLRYVIAFIYLTFIPGILILRLLHLENINILETILYSAGLSIAVLMFTGFFMNIAGPAIGIKNPITPFPLISTISLMVLGLSILCYIKDENKEKNHFFRNLFEHKDSIPPSVLLVLLLPFLAIIGTYLMNSYQNNILLMVLISLIALITLLVAYEKIPKKYFTLTIFIISLSLLLHNSLISDFLVGWDINKEYYIANLVISNGIWDYTIPGNVNAMLSITILAPVYSIILNTNLIWIFKVIYPIIFSLVPLGLYNILRMQLKDKIAFFSTLFYIFLYVFYVEMIFLARQEIAELFFMLSILVIVRGNNKIGTSFLLIIFVASLAVSHYGLSYLVMVIFFLATILLFVFRKLGKLDFFNKLKDKLTIYDYKFMLENQNIKMTFVLFFIVFGLAWYMFLTNSQAFVTIVKIGDHIASSMYTEFMNPNSVQGLYLITKEASSPLNTFSKVLHLTSQFLIIVGFLSVILKFNKFKLNIYYLMYSLIGLLLLIISITVPYFSSSLNTSRVYQIVLFFLAPFCVIGAICLLNLFNKYLKRKMTCKSTIKICAIFLVVFLAFNTGLSFEVLNDTPISYSLNNDLDYPKFNSQDYFGAKWVMGVKTNNSIYADDYRFLILFLFNQYHIGPYRETNELKSHSYIYLGSFNTLNNKMRESSNGSFNYTTTEKISKENEIYDNGGSKIFLT